MKKLPHVFCTAMVDQGGAALVMIFRNQLPMFVLEARAAAAFGESLAQASELARAMADALEIDPQPVTRGPAS